MGKTLNIAPVSRIEGHASVSIHLNDTGNVEDAKLHVLSLRGFEKFVVGRPVRKSRVLLIASAVFVPGSTIWPRIRPRMSALGFSFPRPAKNCVNCARCCPIYRTRYCIFTFWLLRIS